MPKEWTFAETIESLELRFPWLAVDPESEEWIDVEPTSGADVINTLQEWYDELCAERDDAERGAVSLPLLAFQAAAALGLASGVAAVVSWAQGVLGGLL